MSINNIEMSLDEIVRLKKQNRQSNAGNNNQTGNKGGASRNNICKNQACKSGGGVIRAREQGSITKKSKTANCSNGLNRIGRTLVEHRSSPKNEVPRLILSNLHFKLTDTDIYQVFGEVGQLKSARINYSQSGESLGTGEVVYERKADAFKALQKYRGALLNGRNMIIRLASLENSFMKQKENIVKNRIEIKKPNGLQIPLKIFNVNQSCNQQSGQTKVENQGSCQTKVENQGKSDKKQKETHPTSEELDAQLDEYFLTCVNDFEDECSFLSD